MRRIKTLILFISLVILLNSCSFSQNSDKNLIKIGVILPLSGDNYKVSKDIQQALDLAVDIVNYKYDLPMDFAETEGLPNFRFKKIKLIYKDYGNNREKVSDLVDQLVKEDQVSLLVGCYFSNATALASERAEMYDIPFFTFTSTAPILTRRGLRHFYRTTPDDEIFSTNFFDFLNELEKSHPIPKRIVVVYENSIWGTNVAQAEMRIALRNNYKIVDEISYDFTKLYTENHIKRIQDAMPAIIMHASYDQDAIQWMKAYKKYNINPYAILAMNAGFSSPSFVDSLGTDSNFIFSRETWAKDINQSNMLSKRINDLYRVRYQQDMTGNSARAFTGIFILASILNHSQSISPYDIKKSTMSVKIPKEQLIMPWEGIQFDRNGQNILGKGIIVQIQNEKPYVVWPKEMAKTEMILPFPEWSKRR
jgi:branched-chain amino acid transport system substrate-binding protein